MFKEVWRTGRTDLSMNRLMEENTMEKALEGIRVIDLGQVIAMPYCTMLLADLGAEVIKVEERDQAALWLMFGPRRVEDGQVKVMPSWYLYVNRNKKHMTLNLKTAKGLEILKELVKYGDVFIENFSVGTTKRLGIDYDSLKKINPKIIYASVSAFGQSGPIAHHRGYDILAQARSGYMSITGFPDGPPTKSGQSISDYYAGLLSTISILAALRYRDATGQGQYIDIALLDSLVTCLDSASEYYTLGGQVVSRAGNRHFATGGYGVYAAKDGYVVLALISPQIWERFCDAIGKPELKEDPRLSSLAARMQNPALADEIAQEWAKDKTKEEVVKILAESGVPAAPVNTIEEMVNDPQIQARNMFVEMEHPDYGKVKITGSPLKLSKTPGKVEKPAPGIGQHTEEVLTQLLGYTKEEVAKLEEEEVV
ncbi:MAG: CoA transferase [Candidatus Tectomicrobia bacterium]|nr:CoA transferase [Candidatus Tectomicrobia bacterium]